MAISAYEQVAHLMASAARVLIVFPGESGGDGLGSALACARFFARPGRQIDIVGTDLPKDHPYHFLPQSDTIKPFLPPQQKFVITINVRDHGVKDLSYDVKDDQLRIMVTPKQGTIDHHLVTTAQSPFLYDVVFVLGAPTLDSLHDTYKNNTSLFQETPVIAIDRNTEHTRYGHINIIDITKTTIAEVCYELFKHISKEPIHETTATMLLTGIIAATRSFKSGTLAPATLRTASELIENGADRGHIVRQLFYTKRISTLKLWGSILSHLAHDPSTQTVTSTVTRDELTRSGSNVADALESIDELITNAPEAKKILLFIEDPNTPQLVHVILRTTRSTDDAKQLLQSLHPEGNAHQARLLLSHTNLKDAEALVLPLLAK